ncbi:hypothetical protein NDU88_007891 [Pleurodeles waltl]|uniref:Uncharacterized protein n=1 Tax=Pleurodeles waltl TaxID=8319 RepID=A0AAV7NUD1_PLEWA|nr:hypothetical protein NDU88_007891 [Pleurodeles waltl]
MLTSYRVTPHSVAGKMPFELLRRRKPSTSLVPWWLMERNQVKFGVECDKGMRYLVRTYQLRTKLYHDIKSSVCELSVGQSVRVKLPGNVDKGRPRWSEPRKIVKVLRNAVKLDDGRIWNVRRLSICRSGGESDGGFSGGCNEYLMEGVPDVVDSNAQDGNGGCGNGMLRRSGRERKAPAYLDDYVNN